MSEQYTGGCVPHDTRMCNGPDQQEYLLPVIERFSPLCSCAAPLLSEQARACIREEVHRVLYPAAGLVNGHEHRRIEMIEENGKHWRGMLYAVEEE